MQVLEEKKMKKKLEEDLPGLLAELCVAVPAIFVVAAISTIAVFAQPNVRYSAREKQSSQITTNHNPQEKGETSIVEDTIPCNSQRNVMRR